MLTAEEVARYFLSKDVNRELFTKKLITKNGRTFYSGNARLNKYLHLSQNVYIGMTGNNLFSDDLYAYDNGAIVPSVSSQFPILFSSKSVPDISDKEIKTFLDKMYSILGDAELEELIEISHEDDAWQAKSNQYYLTDEKMDTLAFKDI